MTKRSPQKKTDELSRNLFRALMEGSFPNAVSSAGHALRTVGRGLLDLVYPPRCLGCGARAEL